MDISDLVDSRNLKLWEILVENCDIEVVAEKRDKFSDLYFYLSLALVFSFIFQNLSKKY